MNRDICEVNKHPFDLKIMVHNNLLLMNVYCTENKQFVKSRLTSANLSLFQICIVQVDDLLTHYMTNKPRRHIAIHKRDRKCHNLVSYFSNGIIPLLFNVSRSHVWLL